MTASFHPTRLKIRKNNTLLTKSLLKIMVFTSTLCAYFETRFSLERPSFSGFSPGWLFLWMPDIFACETAFPARKFAASKTRFSAFFALVGFDSGRDDQCGAPKRPLLARKDLKKWKTFSGNRRQKLAVIHHIWVWKLMRANYSAPPFVSDYHPNQCSKVPIKFKSFISYLHFPTVTVFHGGLPLRCSWKLFNSFSLTTPPSIGVYSFSKLFSFLLRVETFRKSAWWCAAKWRNIWTLILGK